MTNLGGLIAKWGTIALMVFFVFSFIAYVVKALFGKKKDQ